MHCYSQHRLPLRALTEGGVGGSPGLVIAAEVHSGGGLKTSVIVGIVVAVVVAVAALMALIVARGDCPAPNLVTCSVLCSRVV